MPAADTITVDTDIHHGYSDIIAASTASSEQWGILDASNTSESSYYNPHGRYSVPSNAVSVANSRESASLVRPVLKKPSTCFPIIEHDESEPTWDEDGTVFTSVGDCRVSVEPSLINNPTLEEEETACDMPVAYMPSEDKVTLLQFDGDLPAKDAKKVMELAIKGCKILYEKQKKALEERWVPEVKK